MPLSPSERRRGWATRKPGERVRAFLCLLPFLGLFVACGDVRPLIDEGDPPPDAPAVLSVSPSQLDAFGNAPITIVQHEFDFVESEPVDVIIDSHRCLDVTLLSNSSLRCLPQGTSQSGPVWLSLKKGTDGLRVFDALRFSPPQDALFKRLAAIGDALTAGVTAGSLTPDTQRQSIPALLARQAKAYFPMPLVARPGFPPFPAAGDLAPLTGMLREDWDADFFDTLEKGEPDPLTLRADPDVRPFNLALPSGGALTDWQGTAPMLARGAVYARFMHGLSENEGTDILLERLKDIEPTILFAGYDLLEGMLSLSRESGEALRPDLLRAEFDLLFEKLHDVDSPPVLVLMNLPPGNFWPRETYREWRRYEAIWLNNALHEAALVAMAKRPGLRIVIVDTFSFIFEVIGARGLVRRFDQEATLEEGPNGETDFVVLDETGATQRLGFDLMEGLFSLDARTLTATGNALMANLVIETLNHRLGPDAPLPLMGRDLPFVDLAPILAEDPQSPAQLEKSLEGQGIVPARHLADSEGLPPLHLAHRCAVTFAPSLRPDPDLCPAGMTINEGRLLEAKVDTPLDFVVRITGPDRGPLAGYPLAVHARGGRIAREALVTEGAGRVTVRYFAQPEPGHDTLTLVCGELVQRVQVTVSD